MASYVQNIFTSLFIFDLAWIMAIKLYKVAKPKSVIVCTNNLVLPCCLATYVYIYIYINFNAIN